MQPNQTQPIYHLTPAAYFEAQPDGQPYYSPAFSQDGFIHCTAGVDALLEVANTFFAHLPDDLLALEIDPVQLTAPLRFEPPIPPADATELPTTLSDTLFPHLYGPLDRAAIINRIVLQRDAAGRWQMPAA